MKPRAAVIKDGVVVDIKVATPEFAVKMGWLPLAVDCGIGWRYDGENFISPDPSPKEDENIDDLIERDMNSPLMKAVLSLSQNPNAESVARSTLRQAYESQRGQGLPLIRKR